MFTRARPAGLWIPGSVIAQAEIEHLDDYYFAVDGRGGTYAPPDPIVIGGDGGVTLAGASHLLTGTLTVDSLAVIKIASGGKIKADGGGDDIELAVVAGVGTLTVKNGAYVLIKEGGSVDVFGSLTLKAEAAGEGPGSLTAETGTSLFLNAAHVVAGKFTYPVTTISAENAYRVFGVGWLFKPGEWTEDADDAYIETTANTGEVARAPLVVPPGTLNAVTITIKGSTFFSALPANVPTLTVYKQNLLTGAIDVLATQADTSVNFTAYHAVHQITASGIGATIDPTVEQVWIKLASENGANSNFPMRLYRSVRTAVEIEAIYGH